MATLNPVIVPAKLLVNGTHKVRIAVAHNGQTRYITTNIILDSTNQLRNGQIVKHIDAMRLNSKLRAILQSYQDALDELPYIEGLNCSELVSLIKGRSAQRYRSIKSVLDEYTSLSDISEGSVRTYGIAHATLSKAIDFNMILDNITPATILRLDKKLRSFKLAPSTIRNYMGCLRSIIRYAMKSGYVEYKIDPFSTYTFPKTAVRDVWLTVEDIKAIRDCKPRLASIELCRDMFMLSYYLGGINMIDLLQINFKKTDTLKFVRQKVATRTATVVEFDIPDEAKAIIKKYIGRNGRINARIGPYSLNHDFNVHHMPKLAEAAGIKRRVIYYSARKSFAQHAFHLGVAPNTIDYILGHNLSASKNVIYHYITVTPDMATKAIRLVLDNLKK